MSVAVIIVNYNSASLLEKCLQSLSDQTLKPDRVIVVDNASTEPGSLSLLEEITNAEVIHSKSNIGYGGAINLAVRTLGEETYFCCLNPDAFPEPDWLAQLVNAANKNPGFGSYASLQLDANNPDLVDGAGDELHLSGLPWRRFHRRPVSDVHLAEEKVLSACAGAAMYRLEDFRAAGGFDETFFMYVEDIDLGLRLLAIDRPCLFVPAARVAHIGSATTGSGSDFSMFHGHRNLVWNYFKNLPWLFIILLLPVHLLMTFVVIAWYLPRGKGGVLLRAKWAAIRSLRSYVASTRRVPARSVWPLLSKSLVR